ncbi:UDP-galactopyranose mutase [Belliella kenyensis]|uniref:UDP-galactopyranose mutase n=1 Tax=Belliella kenyensis TaxID=1472724 RepID=A0ABV8EMP3_9BACT|nr:UDP-galactopyranose mutase [Belliella kenyensis]MCH7401639.1 UDP-galactopyranose mutase [Belliella kenyensis]MDN3603083.1 UDP-galactopyranose mutase [Belliella kenyensis]
MNFAIAGAGFSGAVLARELAMHGHHVTVFESRNHLGGNCYTERDAKTGVMVHRYGPHIFHTDHEKVWEYVNRFAEFVPYINRVKATYKQNVYSLPINLHTINQFFGKAYGPKEAKRYIQGLADQKIKIPQSFEEQALKFVGKELYEAFLKGYTEKQWGLNPKSLPASILKRLPLRFDYNDNYFNHKYQGIPREGYTPIFEKLLDHQLIEVILNTAFDQEVHTDYDHVFYTGPIDAWFGFAYGRLGYRTLEFKSEIHDGDFQGCAVMNYSDSDVPFTRISEHKYFAPWESHEKTIIFKEYSKSCEPGDIPYYPIRLLDEKKMLNQYLILAKNQVGVSFLGRLGTYRYLDMDVTVKEALEASELILACIQTERQIPSFFIDPA